VSVYNVEALIASQSFSAPLLIEIPLVQNEVLKDDVLLGKQVFYNADDPRMSRESYLSCASCHVDGGHDGMVWDFTERGEGLRNTISLKGRSGMGDGNVHWTANFNEIQDFENDIRNGFGGIGFLTDEQFAETSNPLGTDKAGLSVELDALAAYSTSLMSFGRSPFRNADGQLSEMALQGLEIFKTLDCGTCHVGDSFTDGNRHVLDNLVPGSGMGLGVSLTNEGIDTPTLLGLWNGGPYFHHGQTDSVEAVLKTPTHGNAQNLNKAELDALTIFLLSLDQPETLDSLSQTMRTSEWTSSENLLRNGRFGCLDVEAESRGAAIVLGICGEDTVGWYEGDDHRFKLESNLGLCMEWNGWGFGWSRLYLAECSENRRQKFHWGEVGNANDRALYARESGAFVIDAFGMDIGSKVG